MQPQPHRPEGAAAFERSRCREIAANAFFAARLDAKVVQDRDVRLDVPASGDVSRRARRPAQQRRARRYQSHRLPRIVPPARSSKRDGPGGGGRQQPARETAAAGPNGAADESLLVSLSSLSTRA